MKNKDLDLTERRVLKAILVRSKLSCPHCPPNRNENSNRRSTHGPKKPKRKDKRNER